MCIRKKDGGRETEREQLKKIGHGIERDQGSVYGKVVGWKLRANYEVIL